MLNKSASRDLGREVAEKIAFQTPRDRYEEYDRSKDVLKRDAKWILPGTIGGAAIGGAMAGKGGAARGALAGFIGSTLGANIHQTVRDSKAAEKRYAGSPKDIRTAKMWGPGVADKRIRRREAAIQE